MTSHGALGWYFLMGRATSKSYWVWEFQCFDHSTIYFLAVPFGLKIPVYHSTCSHGIVRHFGSFKKPEITGWASTPKRFETVRSDWELGVSPPCWQALWWPFVAWHSSPPGNMISSRRHHEKKNQQKGGAQWWLGVLGYPKKVRINA